MHHIFIIHLTIDVDLGCFQYLVIMNKAVMVMDEQVDL